MPLQPVGVDEILRSARRPLVADQILPADDRDRKVADPHRRPTWPGLCKGEPRDARQNVDPRRGRPDLEDRAWLRQVVERKVEEPCAASACAPTTRNSAPPAESSDSISTKSGFIEASLLEGPGV
jgi:hypothetical protein